MPLQMRVCRLDEVVDGELKSFPVEGLQVPVLVTRLAGAIIAGTSMCPHEDVSLTRGHIEDGTIVCSAHGYAFDLRDGQCTHDPTLRWRRYRCSIIGEDVYVSLM